MMKFCKSWLLIAILVGLVCKNVFSFPANRAIDLANELVSEDTDADDQYDEADAKTDDASKRAEITKEGSGSESSKKAAVEPKDSALVAKAEEETSGETEGDEDKSVEKTTDDDKGKEETVTETKEKKEVSKKNTTEEEDSSKKKTDLPKPAASLKKRNGCCECCCPEEEHEDCCHHQHEHEGCCHEGCCCGHENEHEHGHHEHEDCCHHHGHHHGFCHEWGQECCGEHHGHECCGHHEHGHHHNDDHEHEHCHCQGCCEHHEEEEPECCCCCGGGGGGGGGNGRSNVPLGYHCHDMVSKVGSEKTKRYCVPVYGSTETTRDTIEPPSVVKKQTVHVGYGYASGDNYRLGYQEGGMGGLASSFTGQVGADHGGNFDAADHFNKRSLYSKHSQPQKRHYDGGHGFGSFNSGMMHGSATPYGHPVTHPGFTTMGFPGHALASQDVRNMISHPKLKRQAYGQESQDPGMIQQQMNSMGPMEMGSPQMEQAQAGFPGMIPQSSAESEPMQMGGMPQEEMQGSMKSMLPRFSNVQSMSNYPAMSTSAGGFSSSAQFVGGRYFSNFQ